VAQWKDDWKMTAVYPLRLLEGQCN